MLSFTAARWISVPGPSPCHIDLVYVALFKSQMAALPSFDPLTITDHALEAVTQTIPAVCTRMMLERERCIDAGPPALREMRQSRTI